MSKSLHVFDVFDWLKKYFPSESICRDNIPNVLDFSLIWSLFEKEVCVENANAKIIQDFTNKIHKSKIENIDSCLQFFRERYLDGGTTNYKFNDLHIERCKYNSDEGNKIKSCVATILKDRESKHASVLYALLIISYRLRNNLFHGVKNISELREQESLFYNVNQVLAKAIELHKEYC